MGPTILCSVNIWCGGILGVEFNDAYASLPTWGILWFSDSVGLCDKLRFRQLTFRHLVGQVNCIVWSVGKQGYFPYWEEQSAKAWGWILNSCLTFDTYFGLNEILKLYFLLWWSVQFLQSQYITKHWLACRKVENVFVEGLIICRMIVFHLHK